MSDASDQKQTAAPETAGRTIRWWAGWYDTASWLMSFGQAGAIKRRTIEIATPANGEKVLDVGCGTGALTFEARAAAPAVRIHGIDASPEMIEVARKKARGKKTDIDFQVAVIERLPFGDGEFDLVLSGFMLHHLPEDVKRSGMAEVARVLKPGGRFVAVDFGGSGGGFIGHIVTLFGHGHPHAGMEQLLGMIKDAGFAEAELVETKFKSLALIRARK
jgi:demethylmenaquinone methyltransferase/2-methoxy-6-polyprenyl-1,4-benzoquinol methylase/phosphoethanolamine N-methyltransferase